MAQVGCFRAAWNANETLASKVTVPSLCWPLSPLPLVEQRVPDASLWCGHSSSRIELAGGATAPAYTSALRREGSCRVTQALMMDQGRQSQILGSPSQVGGRKMEKFV